MQVEVFLEDAVSCFDMFDRLFVVFGLAVGFSHLVMHFSIPGFEAQGFLEVREAFRGGPVVAAVAAAELCARNGPPFFHVQKGRFLFRDRSVEAEGF